MSASLPQTLIAVKVGRIRTFLMVLFSQCSKVVIVPIHGVIFTTITAIGKRNLNNPIFLPIWFILDEKSALIQV